MNENSVLNTETIQRSNKSLKLPCFIEIQKTNNRKIKIPCANEIVASKVMERLKRLKTESTITLLT